MQGFILKKILLLLLIASNSNILAQRNWKFAIGLNVGDVYSTSKITPNKGNPSPDTKTKLYHSEYSNFLAINAQIQYKKIIFESGVDYTETGATVIDYSSLSGTSYGMAVGPPMVYVPFRIGYFFPIKKRLGITPKIGYMQYKREDNFEDNQGFLNGNCVGFGDYRFCRKYTTGFTLVSRNIQIGSDAMIFLGKKRQHQFYLFALYNIGLQLLSETEYRISVEDGREYNAYVRRNGTFFGLITGYRKCF